MIENFNLRENDFVNVTKNKIIENVTNFIDKNVEYSSAQKEQHKEKIKEAVNLALEIHKDQKPRPDGPYVNHILRVSKRIIDDYDIKDPEIIIAAILHDSVEDQSEKLANMTSLPDIYSKREKSLFYIKNTFGQRVEKIIKKLTNPEIDTKQLSQEEKNNIYKEHVQEAIKDPDVLPIKLSDFSDNALNLEIVFDSTKRLKLSKKYLPVMEIFIERLNNSHSIFSEEKISQMCNYLSIAINNTRKYIQTQENI